jgi:hypothetical protein
MASNITTVGGMATVLFIIVVFTTSFNVIGGEIQQRNPNLDNSSYDVLSNLSYGATNTYNNNSFSLTGSSLQVNLTSNGSNEGIDPYIRQYVEDKQTGDQNKGVIARIINIPKFIYLLIGIPMPQIIITLFGIIGLFIAYMIGIAIYKFLKGEAD